jgi:tRNA G10  N-methylase Trm11
MDKFEAKSICLLGRQPALGLAELESLYGSDHIRPLEGAALLDIPAEDINFKRLGGTIKVARTLVDMDTADWGSLAKYLIDKVPDYVAQLPEGKFTLGLSVYGLNVRLKQIERTLLELKKLVRQSGRPVRIVPNKALALNSAQVLHNKLTHKGAWELIYIKNGDRSLLAQTLFVQDIEGYAARDQARPARDSRVGMLPPKLAQIILNLAAGAPETRQNKNWDKDDGLGAFLVLDPFCGTGVILQEALLMGYSVYGSDIDPRMVEYTKKNLQWLVDQQASIEGKVTVEAADATSYQWPGFSTVASELYLGRPLNSLPAADKLKEIISDVNLITKKFLKNLAPQLKPGRTICLAVPAWRQPDGQLIYLPVIDQLTDMGYNYSSFKHVGRDRLVYFREDQVVARQLLRLSKADK